MTVGTQCLKPLWVVNSFIDPNPPFVCLFFLAGQILETPATSSPCPLAPWSPSSPTKPTPCPDTWVSRPSTATYSCNAIIVSFLLVYFVLFLCWFLFFQSHSLWTWTYLRQCRGDFSSSPFVELVVLGFCSPSLCTQPTSEPPVFTTQTVELYLNSSRQLRSIWFQLTSISHLNPLP